MTKKSYPKTKCIKCGFISYSHPPSEPCPQCLTGITKVLKKKSIFMLNVITVAIFQLSLVMASDVLNVILVP